MYYKVICNCFIFTAIFDFSWNRNTHGYETIDVT